MTKILKFIKRKWVVVTIAAVVLAASIGGIVLATNGFSGAEKGSSSKPVSAETTSVDTTSVQTSEPEAESGEEQGESEVSEVQEPESQTSEEPQVSSEASKKNAWLDGYAPTHGEPGEIDAELLKEIQNAYAEKNTVSDPNNISVSKYYGVYNGYVVVNIYRNDLAYLTAMEEEQIGDVVISYSWGHSILTYKDGTFSGIKKAYENGWISDIDLKDIVYYQSNPKRFYD